MTDKELRQIVKDAGLRLLEENLVQGTWGNISIKVDDKTMLVTPSGMDYVRMTIDDLVPVDIYSLEYDKSGVKPTSEKKIHAAVYRRRPEITAVIHSHPLYCCSVAASRRDMPVKDSKLKEKLGTDIVHMGEYGLPGTKKLTTASVEALGNANACFMANHGMLACGKDMDDAFAVCSAMETAAKAFIESECASKLGKDVYENGDLEKLFRQKYSR